MLVFFSLAALLTKARNCQSRESSGQFKKHSWLKMLSDVTDTRLLQHIVWTDISPSAVRSFDRQWLPFVACMSEKEYWHKRCPSGLPCLSRVSSSSYCAGVMKVVLPLEAYIWVFLFACLSVYLTVSIRSSPSHGFVTELSTGWTLMSWRSC